MKAQYGRTVSICQLASRIFILSLLFTKAISPALSLLQYSLVVGMGRCVEEKTRNMQ